MEFIKSVQGSTTNNFKLYEQIIEQYPHVEKVLKVLCTAPRYCIHHIRIDEEDIVFFMYQSCTVYCRSEILAQYDVNVQFPGNQVYNFSININKNQI